MSVSIGTSQPIGASTFYRNKDFNITFTPSTTAPIDTAISFCNSPANLLPYTSSGTTGTFASTTGISTLGSAGTLSVDVVSQNPLVIGTLVSSSSYIAIGGGCADRSGNLYFLDGNDQVVYRTDLSGTSPVVFAGTFGVRGDADGPRLSAQFREPLAITTDGNGTFYVTDQYRLRKIDSNGTVSTIAGSTIQSFADGTGSAVRFRWPNGLCLLPSGDVIIVDSDNHIVRLCTPSTGVVTTYAGQPFNAGFADGARTSVAKFYFPVGVVYDSNTQTIYIADQYNNRIRAISNNIVSTYAGTGADATGTGPRLSTPISRPVGLTRDSNGVFYMCSFERHEVRQISNDTISTIGGQFNVPGYADGAYSTSLFNGPGGVFSVSNTLYITDFWNGRLRTCYIYPELRPGTPRTPSTAKIIATSNYGIATNSRIDVCWTSVGGLISLYKFESFGVNSFVANRCGGTTTDVLTYAATSSELNGFLSGSGTTTALFRGTPTVAYTTARTLQIDATSNGTVVDSVSTSVTISPARLLVTPCNTSFTFYRNEPLSPVTFSIACNAASAIYAATTLPVGLSLTTRAASNAFSLTGTPTAQLSATNYKIIGQDTSGRLYTTEVSLTVGPERFLLSSSGDLTIQNVLPTAAISPVSFTSQFPPYPNSGAMRYSWSPLPPAGIQFYDKDGNAIVGSSLSIAPFVDPSYSLTLAGTITPAQIQAFASNNVSSYSLTLSAVRTFPLPQLAPAASKTITFQFGETLTVSSNVPATVIAGVPVSSWSYSAKTYFRDLSITNISLVDGFLPDGLTGAFTPLSATYAITGTPTFADTYSFTLRATNGSTTVEIPVTKSVISDSVTIATPSDTCFNFIQNRDLSTAKTGYYTSNLTYTVRATSLCNATLSATNLPTGVTLQDTCFGSYRLTGRPTTATGASTATLTASVPTTGATATTTFAYSVSADFFTFQPLPPIPLQQNTAMTAVQFDASTFSESPILRYSAPTLPASLFMTTTGLLSGTMLGDTSGSFPVIAYSAYGSGARTYSYSTTPDQVLLVPTPRTTITAPGQSVSISITGYSLSALLASNYRFASSFPYGLSLNSTTGLLSGTLTSSLPASVPFTVLGSVGTADGTLQGSMTTTNLTINRAHVIENRSGSNLRLYSSDDTGTTWTSVYTQSNEVALRIGKNGNGLFLIPTSSGTVLRRTPTASTFGAVTPTLPSGWSGGIFTGVANKTGTSTWWIGGTLSNAGTRTVYVFKTTDDGVTWDSGTAVTTNGFKDRGSNSVPYPSTYNAYLNGGVELAYRDGVLLLGGNQLLRSTDDGATWSAVPSALNREIGMISTDQGDVWVLAGSDTYSSLTDNIYTSDARTLQYSTDLGATWSNATGGFTMNAYQVVYGGGAWLASGLNIVGAAYVQRILMSLDGVNWSILFEIPFLSEFPGIGLPPTTTRPPGVLSPIGFDGTDWKVFRVPNDTTVTLYSHPYNTPLTSGWTTQTLTSQFSGVTSTSRFSSYVSQLVDPGADVTTITFPVSAGPTFVSPAQTTYVLWQYMPIPPISVSATSSATPVSYFVSTLPVGLTWNPSTQTITGACMRTGRQSFTLYAKDSLGGVTEQTIVLIVDVPRIVKKQTGAGAYTALVRDYTEVAAALNARDSHVNPPEPLGSFASPYPPDVVTPSNCPC